MLVRRTRLSVSIARGLNIREGATTVEALGLGYVLGQGHFAKGKRVCL